MTHYTHAHLGHLAGEVYRCLEQEGRAMSVMDLSVKKRMWPWDVVLAFGWLQREDKIRLHRRLAALTAELKK
ncbi:MAG: winged helix-turn-helix domain-containing protein [Candidatus Altiarchaeota archaeon]